MQFELGFRSQILRSDPTREAWLTVGGRKISVRFVMVARARRYILRLQPDGTARLTIPRRGSLQEALRFASKNLAWLERQLLRQACEIKQPIAWGAGTSIWFRGQTVPLLAGTQGAAAIIHFGQESVRVDDPGADLRPKIENHLRKLATGELQARTLELSRWHGIAIARVSVRNQRSRWGSCSPRGTISLNWRLIQTPDFVRDYIILHELAHRREMNHSRRFWREVERLCPNYREAERWLRQHAGLLG